MVTDRHGAPRALVETVQAVLAGGARWIWFRDRDLRAAERHALARRVAALVSDFGGVLSIGGDRELAVAVGAGGVHLGGGSKHAAISRARRSLGMTGLIGVSAHTLRDVEAAAEGGADYVTLSPIFSTPSKPGYGPALGPDAVTQAARIGLPVIALGGIDVGNAAACRGAGAAGMAVMGGLMRADDPAGATRALLTAWTARRSSIQDTPAVRSAASGATEQ